MTLPSMTLLYVDNPLNSAAFINVYWDRRR